jgi:acyl dehydratase
MMLWSGVGKDVCWPEGCASEPRQPLPNSEIQPFEEKRHAMEIIGLGRCWEDMPVGYRFRTVGRTVTETDLVNFVGNTGMVEVLFTNTRYAREQAPGGGRIVAAALLLGIAEGLVIQATLQGTGLAFIHMELDVKGPSFAGDTIHVEAEVLESRPSSSDPRRGLVRTRNQIVNQNGDSVIVYTPLRLMVGRELLAHHREATCL